jgi:hypothetical protein
MKHNLTTLTAILLLHACAYALATEPAVSPTGEPVDSKITRMSTPPTVDGKLAASFTGKAVAHRVECVAGIAVDCIYVNLNDPRARVDVEMSSSGIGSSENWSSLVHRAGPVAAINGTFFDKHTLRPTGDIVRKGKSVYYGGLGSGLCIAADNKACVASAEWGKHVDWTSFETVLSGGFMLLQGGRIVVDPAKERFKDSHVFGRARRSAIGVTNINRLVLVTTRKGATPRELATVMKGLQCLDAVGIDGGASAAMYYRGQTLCKPGRALTNILVVYEDGAVTKPAPTQAAKPDQGVHSSGDPNPASPE